jgi:acetyltransferase-like isoleucine patch superfamily enzyme
VGSHHGALEPTGERTHKFVSTFNQLILRVKRGDTPVSRMLRAIAKFIYSPSGIAIPGFLKPVCRVLYELHYLVIVICRNLVTKLYRHPLFQARCASIGKNVIIEGLPFVTGHAEIHIGSDIYLGGMISIMSARFEDRPQLFIADRVGINWHTAITVNKLVVIEHDVKIASNVRISDSDGHPRQADLRARNAPVSPRDIRPVRICSHAWIGAGAHIMKGVTIGEGAIVAAGAVVVSDVPPYSLAMGNPAEVYFRNFGKPASKDWDPENPML